MLHVFSDSLSTPTPSYPPYDITRNEDWQLSPLIRGAEGEGRGRGNSDPSSKPLHEVVLAGGGEGGGGGGGRGGEGEGYTLYPVVNIRNLPAELAQDFTHLRYIHVQEGEEPKGGRGRKILFSWRIH